MTLSQMNLASLKVYLFIAEVKAKANQMDSSKIQFKKIRCLIHIE